MTSATPTRDRVAVNMPATVTATRPRPRVARRLALGTLLLASLAGCRVGREHAVPEVALPRGWTEAGSAGLEGPPVGRWWTLFGDERLDALIARADEQSLDLAAAAARIREARALRDAAAGGRAPALDARAGFARVSPSEATPQGALTGGDHDLWQAGFDASWELDLFGRTGRAVEAAERAIESAEAGHAAAELALRAEVARVYVELRGHQQALELTRANLALQEDTLALTRVRHQGGLAPELDVARAAALVATTRAQVPALETAEITAVHRLGVLLGLPPQTLREELAPRRPIPLAPETFALGIPSELARRRPDVVRAERELARAASLSAQATAELWPRLVIGASLGHESEDAGALLDAASRAWSIGPSLLAPLLRGGTLRARVRAADARVEIAEADYRRTVLEALLEVEDALAAVRRERTRLAELANAVESNRRAAELATDLQARGLIDFFEVLDAQRQQLAAESELARSTTSTSTRAVALYKALGGA